MQGAFPGLSKNESLPARRPSRHADVEPDIGDAAIRGEPSGREELGEPGHPDAAAQPVARGEEAFGFLGEVDLVLDPPAQDLQRLRQQTKIVEGNEYRTIYLGLDQKNPELKYSSIKGKNPFADQRVREALYVAIDIEAIKKAVMRGVSHA